MRIKEIVSRGKRLPFFISNKIPEVLEARRKEMVLEGGKMLLQLEKERHAWLVVVGVHVQLEM